MVCSKFVQDNHSSSRLRCLVAVFSSSWPELIFLKCAVWGWNLIVGELFLFNGSKFLTLGLVSLNTKGISSTGSPSECIILSLRSWICSYSFCNYCILSKLFWLFSIQFVSTWLILLFRICTATCDLFDREPEISLFAVLTYNLVFFFFFETLVCLLNFEFFELELESKSWDNL